MARQKYLERIQDLFEFNARRRNPRFVHHKETNYRFFACRFEDRFLERFKVRLNHLRFIDDRGYALNTVVINGFLIIRVAENNVQPKTVEWILDQGFQEL